MPRCQCGTDLPGRRRVCDPCKALPVGQRPTAPADEVEDPPPPTPAGLHERGRTLWCSLGYDLDSSRGQVALEACRIADRLDELDRVIAGKGVLRLMSFRLDLDLENEAGDREVNVTVSFQNALAEARQQAATFRTLMADLTKASTVGGKTDPAPAAATEPVRPATPLEEMRRRRQQPSA